MIQNEVISSLTSAPGSLAYHIILALSLAVIFSLSYRQLARGQDGLAARWRLASGGLLSVRMVLIVVASLTWLEFLNGSLFLPPLDRAISLAGAVIFIWAMLAPGSQRSVNLIFTVFLVVILLGLPVTMVYMLVSGIPPAFNQSPADAVWGLSGLITVLASGILLWMRRPRAWILNSMGFSLLVLGYALHLAIGPTSGSLAGYVRATELVAYPLFTVGAYQALSRKSRSSDDVPESDSEKTTQSAPSDQLRTLTEIARLISANVPSELAAQVVKSLARIMRAELCLLLTAPDASGQFSIETGYDLIREVPLSGTALDSDRCPVIATALTRHRTITLPETSRSPDAKSLKSALNLRSTGYSLLVPLVSGGELQGGILLLSPYSQRRWQAGDRQILEVIASHLADRFRSLYRASALTIPDTLSGDEALASAQQYIASLEQENSRLDAQLHSPQSESEPAQSDKIAALLELNEAAYETIQNLEAEIERLKAAVAESPDVSPSQEIDQLRSKFQLVLRELSDARSQLATYEARGESRDEGISKSALDITLVTSIARDLRQQMSSILGYTDLLLGESVGLLGSMQRKFIERVRFGVESMATLLEKLTEVTTTDVGIQSLPPKPVDLLDCIEEAVTHASPMIREKKLALRMDFPEQMPKIVGDEDAIIQILIHLLTNATGASPDGEEITIATRVQHAEGADYLMLTISDAGEGIPPKDLGRVFKRVYQADEARIQGVGDGGVGLSIVKALSEALGGRVWFDSEVGVGSTFTVLLPLADQSPAQALGEVYAE